MTSIQSEALYTPEFTFGDRLRRARRSMQMTQAQFANELGVTPSRYAQWEADNNLPRELVLFALKVQLLTRVSAPWLLGADAPSVSRTTNPCLSRGNVILGPWGTDTKRSLVAV